MRQASQALISSPPIHRGYIQRHRFAVRYDNMKRGRLLLPLAPVNKRGYEQPQQEHTRNENPRRGFSHAQASRSRAEAGMIGGVQPFTKRPSSCSSRMRSSTHGELRSDSRDNFSSRTLGAGGSRLARFNRRFLPS
jgi:hypothetical protein